MAMMALKLKIMPSSPEVNLEELKNKIKKLVEKEGKINSIEEEAVAFGLKALIITLAIPETQDTEEIENKIGKLDNISSVKIIDMRRALG